jgi:tRNA pseudouridine38-40 synthase
MNRGARHLLGAHDFSSLCRRPKDQPDAILIRRVRSVAVMRVDDEVHYLVEANAFCTQLVRSMTGLLVAIGRGIVGPDEVPFILAAMDRAQAPGQAPSDGLTLMEVSY